MRRTKAFGARPRGIVTTSKARMLKRDLERSKKTKTFGAHPRGIVDIPTDIEVLRDKGVWRASPTAESATKNLTFLSKQFSSKCRSLINLKSASGNRKVIKSSNLIKKAMTHWN